jgi:hypothetical protein
MNSVLDSLLRRAFHAALPLALLAASAASAAPSYVVITVPAAAPGAASLPALLADWRKNGLVSDDFLLASAPAKAPAFSQVAVLEFPD